MLNPPLGPAAIAALVPHQGAMCLLDAALEWDEHRILCATRRHLDASNPLRRDGMLPAVCGLEFALQAMALHGALGAGAAQRRGFVSSLRDVTLGVARLDDLPQALMVEAVALVAESGGFIYRFDITHDGQRVIHGQAAVILARETFPA